MPFRSEKMGGCAGGDAEERREPIGGEQQEQADRGVVNTGDGRDRAYKLKRAPMLSSAPSPIFRSAICSLQSDY